MTEARVTLNATGIGGVIIPGGTTPRIVVPADGQIVVNGIDAASYVAAGAKFTSSRSLSQALPTAPRAGSAGRVVSSVALGNGTLSIANQPDVPRQLGVYVDPGTTAITAGNIAVTYTANDGTTQVDNVTPVSPASTPKTVSTSKGVVALTSVIVTALAGGTSPKVQVNDTNSLSMEVPPNYSGFTLTRAYADGVVDGTTAVASSAASYTPSTTPNGTHTYSALFAFVAP